MDRLQLLLSKLAEEGTEVAQIALKTAQFGLHESREGQYPTNAERCHADRQHAPAPRLVLARTPQLPGQPHDARHEQHEQGSVIHGDVCEQRVLCHGDEEHRQHRAVPGRDGKHRHADCRQYVRQQLVCDKSRCQRVLFANLHLGGI